MHQPDRDAEILEVRGSDGEPPYLVRWSEDGRLSQIFPGADARVEPVPHHARGSREPGGEPAEGYSSGSVPGSRGRAAPGPASVVGAGGRGPSSEAEQ
jgi:hypothetical protein